MTAMDCNKDEACRLKQIAVEMMVKNDFEGARNVALCAKHIYPEVDNISQLITVCDIHCSAQKKIHGARMDLYGILQVEKLADEITIRKQYRKLALVLHPDKNKFTGAEAAFKLIGEANMVLSDKEKRSAYDIKCREPIKTSVTKIPKRQGKQTSNAGQNKAKNVPKTKFNDLNRVQKSTSNPNIRPTFWTSCPFCKMQYEYYIEFVKKYLRCQHCSKGFIAYDIGPHRGAVRPGFVNEKMQSANLRSKPVFQKKVKVDKQRDDQFSSKFAHVKTKDTEVGGASSTNKMKQKGVIKFKVNVQKPMETVTVNDMNKKRGRKTGMESHEGSSDEKEVADDGVSGDFGGNTVDPRSSQQKHVSYREDGDAFSSPKRSKLVEASNDVEDVKKENASGCVDTSDVSMPNDKHKVKGDEAVISDNDTESDSEAKSVDCPDQEFSNFDKDKEEHCFAVDQIWACYDSVDGMPRFYVEIQKVYPCEFKLRVTWLDPDPEDDLEIIWAEKGLPVACGKFARGETIQTRDRLMFSHQMVCTKKDGSTFSYVICPQKGEIWAFFKNWDIKWSSDPESHKKFKFDIVKILSVHDDCVSVAFLSKVKGFVSVFQRTIGAGLAEHKIPSNERFRFSHRIPSAKLTGTERANVPAGSFELDMASLPGDLEDDLYYYSNNIEKVKPSTNFADAPKKDMHNLGKDLLNLHRSPGGVEIPKQENANPRPMLEVGSDKVNDGQNPSSACGMQISHDFRSDKQIWDFQVGQIWAFWERGNEIRQRYAVIKKCECEPFRLHVSLLKLCDKSCDEYTACGLFKVSAGKPKLLAADSFSHIVKAVPHGKKMFNIHPKENQMWALCKKQEAGGFEIVEVVQSDIVSIKVMPLTCVPGFKSVFKAPRTQSSTEKIVGIPWVELNRFHHQIPAFLFTDGFLRGCWELDPVALTGLQLLEPDQG